MLISEKNRFSEILKEKLYPSRLHDQSLPVLGFIFKCNEHISHISRINVDFDCCKQTTKQTKKTDREEKTQDRFETGGVIVTVEQRGGDRYLQ